MSDQESAPQVGTGPGAAARDEAVRQAVALVGGVVFVLAAVAAERAATDPDFYRTLRMRAAHVVDRAAMRVARTAAEVSARAEQVYRQGCA